MTPTSNAKQVAAWAASLANTGDAILEDKKITLAEGFSLLPLLMQVATLLPVFPAAKDEWVNADNEAKAVIIDHAQGAIDFRNDKLEFKVEAAFGALAHLATLLQK